MARLLPYLFCILSASILLQGQDAQIEGKRVLEIRYLPGQILHEADLAKAQPIKAGDPLRREAVASAIDGLFATGRFENISAEAELSGDGVILSFVTKPAWFVGGVSSDGKLSQPPTRGELVSTAQLSLGSVLREEDISRAANRIRRLMRANGFYEATITPELNRNEEAQNVFVTFQVRQGKRAKYTMPEITGDTKLSDGTIIRATGWRIPLIHWWRQVTDARTRKGIQGILAKYQQQERLKARVELRDLEYDAQRRRVSPQLEINAGPKVRVQAIEAKVSKRVLRRYVPIYQERAVDNDLLVEGARNLRDYFQSKGYYDVDIDYRVHSPSNDEQVIDYIIAQGTRYKLENVTITGNKYFRDEALRERMFMQPATLTMRHGRYSEAFRKKDEENIANLYRANGFRSVSVKSVVDRNYQGKSGEIGVTVQIEEGPQWIVDNLTTDGITQLDPEEIRSELASMVGQPFAEVNMAADRNHILTSYYSQGFPATDFRAAWQPSDTPNHVNIVYTVTEGERQYVRDVITTGLKTTRQSLIDKRITLGPGDPLSPIEQTNIQKSFYDMGIFARVDTAIENPEGSTNHKYILYNFEEANRYTMSLGFGAQIARFGTPNSANVSAPGGATGFSPQASMNLSRLNFLGLGHTVSLRGVYSSLQKRGSISYLAPRFQGVDGRNITVSLLYDNSLDVRTFASKRQEASVQASQRFSKATTGLFRIAYRRVSVSNVAIPVLLIPQLVQPVRLGIISANIAQDRRDDPGNPHRGMYNTGDVSVSSRYLGSQRSFSRILLRNATYHRVTRNTVIARQTQFGVITPFSAPAGLTEQQSVPLPERFFGGGAESLRAFPYNQAGPRDIGAPLVPLGPSSQPTGFPLGGNALLFNNVELRFPLLGPNIQGVLFHDMGNVYSTLSDLSFRVRQRDLQDFNYMVHAVGFGVRYRTPIGPVRGDLAYSINPPSYFGFSGTAQELLRCNPNEQAGELPPVCRPSRQNVSHFQFFFSIGQTF